MSLNSVTVNISQYSWTRMFASSFSNTCIYEQKSPGIDKKGRRYELVVQKRSPLLLISPRDVVRKSGRFLSTEASKMLGTQG